MMGRLRTGFSGLSFYGLAGVLAAELVVLSLGTPPTPRAPVAQAGTPAEAGIVFRAEALQHVALRGLEGYIPRARDGRALALNLAARQGAGDEIGARLDLTPALTAASAGKLVHLEVIVAPLQVTNAAALAVRLEGEAPDAWSSVPLREGKALRLVYDFLAPPTGVRAIWFRPIPPERSDYEFGTQIQRVEMSFSRYAARK